MTILPTHADVLRELRAQFTRRGASPDVAMAVVLPVLQERDAEIERLRELLAQWVTGERSDETS